MPDRRPISFEMAIFRTFTIKPSGDSNGLSMSDNEYFNTVIEEEKMEQDFCNILPEPSTAVST